MIAARESIAEYIKAKVMTDLAGITTPELRFSVRASHQPPEFPNCLNLYFFDDSNVGGNQFNPAYREVTASFELLIEIDPNVPLLSERQAYTAIHLINQFMAVQTCQKMDYSVDPPIKLGSSITWRDSYPLDWTSAPSVDERYSHKSSFLIFRYFEERVIA